MKPAYTRAALGAVLALGMLSVVPGVAFAAAPSCGDTITANTTLHADLDCSGYSGDALTFGKGRITLNLNGYTIWGPSGYDGVDGVATGGYNHVTVTNGTIANYTYGVDNEGSSSSSFTWLKITGDTSDSSDYGIYEAYGAGNTYNHITAKNDLDIGMYLEYGASNRVLNSTFAGVSEDVYFYYESVDTISNVTANSSGSYGFYDYYGARNTYLGNTANGHSSEGFYLYCDDYGKVVLKNNTANNNGGDGFYLYYCYDDNVYGPDGGSTVYNNVAKYNGDNGFEDYYSINTKWTYNFASHNTNDGFYFDYPGVTIIRYNVAVRNGDDGFELYDAYSAGYYGPADMSWNRAKYNDDYGFTADYGIPGQGNVARHNSTQCYNVVCN
jgi:parallel beta-helix repeat protein